MDIAKSYSYRPKTIVLGVNHGYRTISMVFTNNYGYRNYCAIDMNDSYGYRPRTRAFTNNYGYWPVTLVIVKLTRIQLSIGCNFRCRAGVDNIFVNVSYLRVMRDKPVVDLIDNSTIQFGLILGLTI
jgi:hypothetical protein